MADDVQARLGSHRFGDIRSGIPLISQSLLTGRLRALERDGVVERRRAVHGSGLEYQLACRGEASSALQC